MATGEGLLALLPAVEPPAGFETRVLDRLGLSVPASGGDAQAMRFRHARPRGTQTIRGTQAARGTQPARGTQVTRGTPVTRRAPGARGTAGARRLLASAAVALVVIGAGVAGWRIGAATTAVPGPSAAAQVPLNSAALVTPSGQHVGRVFVYQGEKDQVGQQWMYMSVELRSGDGTVTCQVVGTDGKVTTVGSFGLASGYGAWGSAGSWGTDPVGATRLLAANGTVLATATFTQSGAR